MVLDRPPPKSIFGIKYQDSDGHVTCIPLFAPPPLPYDLSEQQPLDQPKRGDMITSTFHTRLM